jgi:hypothetical protein
MIIDLYKVGNAESGGLAIVFAFGEIAVTMLIYVVRAGLQ